MVDGKGFRPDSSQERAAWVTILVLGMVLAGTIFINHPGIPWQVKAYAADVFHDDFRASSDSRLEIPREEVDYLNRIFRELNSRAGDGVGEAGFCLTVIEDTITVQKAGTLEASESSVRFTTANCIGSVDGFMHFHPPESVPILSGPGNTFGDVNDKESFLETDTEVSCVQAGMMTNDLGVRTEAFRCFSKEGVNSSEDSFPEIPVRVG